MALFQEQLRIENDKSPEKTHISTEFLTGAVRQQAYAVDLHGHTRTRSTDAREYNQCSDRKNQRIGTTRLSKKYWRPLQLLNLLYKYSIIKNVQRKKKPHPYILAG